MNDIQKGLLEIIVDIDEVLKKNNVKYSLYCGTAIGAVRHKGFIPWDDDMDIVIHESELDSFKNALNDLPPGKYFLQEPFSIDWANSFYKIKMNGTAAIEKSHIDTRMHQGLFIDVFIARRYPRGSVRKKFYDSFLFFQKAIRRASFLTYGKPILNPVQHLMHAIHKADVKMMSMVCEKDTDLCRVDYVGGNCPILKRDVFQDLIEVDFEGKPLSLISDYDRVLRLIFGDYMTPPPEKDRVGGHIVAFSMDEDYTVWLEKQKKAI